MVDRPYNNPFYSRPIDNFLWLPRNPCATLDLDDTVDLRMPLGIQILEIVSPTEPPQEAETASLCQGLTIEPLPNGTEGLELPEVIMKQIGSKEGGIQHHSVIHHRTSNDASVSPRQHQSSAMNKGPPRLNGRSLSEGINVRPRTSQRSSLQLASHIFRTRSVDIEKGAQRPTGYYDTAKTSEDLSQPQDLPAHQAIVHEVLAEEDLIRQLEEEKINEGKAKVTKSWLTSWMFTKAE